MELIWACIIPWHSLPCEQQESGNIDMILLNKIIEPRERKRDVFYDTVCNIQLHFLCNLTVWDIKNLEHKGKSLD